MSEVLEIEVDGEIDDGISGFGSDGRSPQWGLPAAIAVAGLLLLAVVVIAILPLITGPRASRPSPSSAVATNPAGPVERSHGALAAWGRFAVSGDLKQLDGWFMLDGPQYQRLAEEAGAMAAHPPGAPAYEVILTDPTVMSVTGGRAALRGDVTWTRPGEVDQRYQWEILLHRTPSGRWLLWTVNGA